jgi:methylamine dehydrogenase accessory protein MauD
MITALIVSNVVLWILLLILVAVVFALVRQTGVLFERVAPAGALIVNHGPKVGELAPALKVSNLNGTPLDVGGTRESGRSLLLFFLSPTCPVCKLLLPALKSIVQSEAQWLDVALASDGSQDKHAVFIKAQGLESFPYLLSTELGLTYRVGKLPYAVLLDAAGVLRANGLVNSREHLESLFEAMERGVASLQEYMGKHHPGPGTSAE